MSTLDEFLDSYVSNSGVDQTLGEGTDNFGTATNSLVPYHEPEYTGKIDYRIRQLSYSSLLLLHKCPRKYQLYKLSGKRDTSQQDIKSSITFAFGHAVGSAIQESLSGLTQEQILWNMFLFWDCDIFDSDDKANKSLWSAIIAFKRFQALRAHGVLDEYELVYYKGAPATELSFVINLPDNFRLRGHVDVVLQHKITKKVLVLEIKTTGGMLNRAMYKNSAQALGYSIVLDSIFPELSSYEVLYLVYQTKQGEYTPITFTKTYLQRALWIREILLDIETIKLYEDAEIYPMRGEACFDFYRECEYINTCTLSTEAFTKLCTEADVDKFEYQIELSIVDLLNTQLKKTAHETN